MKVLARFESLCHSTSHEKYWSPRGSQPVSNEEVLFINLEWTANAGLMEKKLKALIFLFLHILCCSMRYSHSLSSRMLMTGLLTSLSQLSAPGCMLTKSAIGLQYCKILRVYSSQANIGGCSRLQSHRNMYPIQTTPWCSHLRCSQVKSITVIYRDFIKTDNIGTWCQRCRPYSTERYTLCQKFCIETTPVSTWWT